MSCDENVKNNSNDRLRDASGSALDGLKEYIEDMERKGIKPSIIGKAGGLASNINSASKVLEAGFNRVLKNSSGLLHVVGQFLRLLLHIVVCRTFSTAC